MPVTSIITESEILSEVLAAQNGDLSPDVAKSLLRWKFSVRTRTRITRLAERNQSGTITAMERETLERYVRVGSLLNLVQAKARLSLSVAAANGE